MSKFCFKKFCAEVLGTFVLVFVACGTAVATGLAGGFDYLATAFAFGLVIVAMAYTIGPVSGCHINPAVSLAMAVNKRITWFEFVYYVVAQFIGATLGAFLLWGMVRFAGFETVTGLGQNAFRDGALNPGMVNIYGAIAAEIVLTFIFILTILAVTGKKSGLGAGKKAGLIIGLTLTLVHLVGIGLTGTSVNPARSFGPAVILGGEALKQVWVFLVAPLVGAVLAAVCGRFLLGTEEAPQLPEL
ncbi:MAG: MIP family channel protein [Firmicutes bacterium]|nr:MIP family channel protein [Bacillota bacterium]